jgi:hypothetical protein
VVLNGVARVVYPLGGLVNLSAGGFSMRAYLNFDPAELDRKAKPGLRNHFFFTIFGPGKSYLCCYTIHYKELRLIGYDEAGREKFSKALPLEWEPFDPHEFGIRWGDKLELTCDGQSVTEPWQGLFNTTTGDTNTLRVVIGSWEAAGAGESCFTVATVQLDDGAAPQTFGPDDILSPYQSKFILEGYPPLPVPPTEPSPSPAPADVRHSFRMTEFRGGDGLTREQAERHVLEYKNWGVNVLMTPYKNRYLFFDRDDQKRTYFPYHPSYETFIRDTRTLVQAAHQQGLKPMKLQPTPPRFPPYFGSAR